MARRQHHNSISLFPFLAVLVCAMGALILLLLVMTRKIRHDQRGESTAVITTPALPHRPDRSVEIAALETQIRTAQDALLQMHLQADAISDSLTERHGQIAALRQELSDLQKQLQAGGGTQEFGVTEVRNEARQLKAREAALLRQLKESERLLFEKQQMLANATDASKEAELLLQEKHSELISLRAQVSTAENESHAASGTSTLLEFSNPTGTARTPIVVEISEKGFEILPNGIRISPADMEGFPVRDNPLLSAILTVHRHRSKNSITKEPYVLLLVRPDGSLPFYGAQRVLMESRIHYGYELLDSEQQILVGEEDPTEPPAVQMAINDALRRRENLYAKLMAIAQQNSELSRNDGRAQGGNGERRLTVRPDGRVIMGDAQEQRPIDGRFYAGGVAPPASLLKNRPAGGYGKFNPDRITAADAERLADEFAERYAKQQQDQQPPANPSVTPGFAFSPDAENPIPRGFGEATGDRGNSSRASAERRFTENLFGSDGSLQSGSFTPRTVVRAPDAQAGDVNPKESTFAGRESSEPGSGTGSDPQFVSDFQSSLSSAESKSQGSPGSQTTGDSRESSFSVGDLGDMPTSKSPDLSKIDPDLLERLSAARKQARGLATPVGITVFLDAHHMTVGQQPASEVTPDTLHKTFETLLTGISTEVDDAELKPDEPVMPIVKFVVSPGGEKWRIPLAHSLKQAGIHSAAVFELTPYMISRDNTGRALLDDDVN